MKYLTKYYRVIIMTLFITTSLPSWAKINVFACEPEWASLTQAIGSNYVKVFSATHARQDPHHIRARPSLIAKMRKADLVFCSGAGLEIGWLPILLQKAGNVHVQPGQMANLMASQIVKVLEKPKQLDRSMGDVHPDGNPHVHLNPHNILPIAKVLTEKLVLIDKANAEHYQNNYKKFTYQWQKAINIWEQQAVEFKGRRVITHHKSWSYFIDWLELELVNTLEPKPGIPPTTRHLETLLKQVRNHG